MLSEVAFRLVRDTLHSAGIEDATFEANLLLEHASGLSRFSDAELDESQLGALRALATRRAEREPLQYLLGHWPFMGLELAVGPGVLIPRADTECVCEAALRAIERIENPSVLDLCSGTGALALGIAAARPDAQVCAAELYEAAFAYLSRNVESFAVEHGNPPRAVRADALSFHTQLRPAGIDLLVCNPPYVTAEEYKSLQPEIYHEPESALVAGEGGLLFYRAIAREYKAALKPGGALVFEIGAQQGPAVAGIVQENGYTGVHIEQDLAGHDRIVCGRAPQGT